MIDFGRYVGIRYVEKGRGFEGVDCYGLLWLAHQCERGVCLPSYADRHADGATRRELSALIEGETRSTWRAIADGGEQAFDALLMRDGREVSHVGMVIEGSRVLHIERGKTSVIDRYRTGQLRHRVVGFYRFNEP